MTAVAAGPGAGAGGGRAASRRVRRGFGISPRSDSTNDSRWRCAAAGAPEGTSVLADAQRAGRGRRGRVVVLAAGRRAVSVGDRPAARPGRDALARHARGRRRRRAGAAGRHRRCPSSSNGRTTSSSGGRGESSAACCASRSGSARPWMRSSSASASTCILPRFRPRSRSRATSIETELGRPIDRAPVVVDVLASLAEVIDRLWRHDHAWVRSEWRRFGRAGLGGASVRWSEQGQDRRGLARDIDDEGALLVDAEGRTQRLVAGEVTWERLGRE